MLSRMEQRCFYQVHLSLSDVHASPTKLKYIDETAELAATYDQDDGILDLDQEHSSIQEQEEAPLPQSHLEEIATALVDNDVISDTGCEEWPTGFHRHTTASFSIAGTVPSDGLPLEGVSHSEDRPIQTPVERQSDRSQSARARGLSGSQKALALPSPNDSGIIGVTSPQASFRSGLVKSPSNAAVQTSSELEVTLLRYFIDVLACWFDICDPEKHFGLIVPHRARWCPPIRKAMIAASARHLTRVSNPTSRPDFIYSYDGETVPGLTEETALKYHSECIKDLLTSSMDPERTQDVNLLAAAIILRFYEEIDAPLRDDASDNELFLRVMNVFIDAQIPSVPLVPHSSPVITGPKVRPAEHYGPLAFSAQATQSPNASSEPSGLNDDRSHWRTDGLCQAGFWVALRQEIHSAFLKQRPFNLALSRCEAFRSFSPAEDAVWADHLIIFCADVLEFCYGNTKNKSPRHDSDTLRKDQWLSLKQYETMWGEVLPASFEPIYFRDPDRSRGEVLPHICYMADCHVAGVQHAELARILLAVYNPTRPRVGPGSVSSLRALSAEIRSVVLRLCGIATSNRQCPPAMVTAYLGIAICGDHFEDPLEQEALLGVLDRMEKGRGWPAADTRQMLKEAWEAG